MHCFQAVESDPENDPLSLMAAEPEEEVEMEEGRANASSRRSSFGLRVALQFPTKKSAEKRAPKGRSSKFCLMDSKHPGSLTQIKNNKTWKVADQEASSGSEEDSKEEGSKEASNESSSALLKRAMNIKENKAMVRTGVQVTLLYTNCKNIFQQS